MSVKAINWAYKQSAGNALAKAVLVRLAEHADRDTGEAWPSVRRMARDTEMSARSVNRSLNELKARGLITITKRIEQGRQTTNLYKLNLPSPDSQTEGGDAQSAPLRRRDSGRVPARQTNIDEPSIEPPMNLPAGVDAACAEGARRLAKDLGEKRFSIWFGDAVIEVGPPVMVRAGSEFKASWINEKLRIHLERAFGRDVVVVASHAA